MKSIITTNINVLLALFLLVSCGDLTGEGTAVEDATSFKVGGVDAVNAGERRFILDGTAKAGGNSGHFFRLGFTLPPGESLKFFFFASREFAGGVEILWMRSAEGEVEMEMSLNGKTHRHRFDSLDEKEQIEVDVDIHNDHTDTHVLLWQGGGPYGDKDGCSFDGECLYNTEDFVFNAWLGVGRASGVYWGVEGDTELIRSLEGPLPAHSDA